MLQPTHQFSLHSTDVETVWEVIFPMTCGLNCKTALFASKVPVLSYLGERGRSFPKREGPQGDGVGKREEGIGGNDY